jgi:hypothetical protein
VRELIMDGRWAEAEDLLAPLSAARGFDHRGVLFALRRQRFLELLAGRLRGDAGGGGGGGPGASFLSGDASFAPGSPSASMLLGASGVGGGLEPSPVMAIVASLRAVEAVCDSKVAFNALCFCLTLPAVNAHPELADWTPHVGRARAFAAVRRELQHVFPAGDGGGGGGGGGGAQPPGQLLRLLAQAAAAQAAARVVADPRLFSVR